MSYEAVQTGDYGAGYSSSVFREKGWDPQEGRRRAYEDTDPFAKAVLFVKGEIICTGKAAIREFEARRKIREELQDNLKFEPVRSPNSRSKKVINFHSQNKTWYIIQESQRRDGFAKVHIHNNKIEHEHYWIYIPDLGRTQKVILWQPVSASGSPIPAKTTTPEGEA